MLELKGTFFLGVSPHSCRPLVYILSLHGLNHAQALLKGNIVMEIHPNINCGKNYLSLPVLPSLLLLITFQNVGSVSCCPGFPPSWLNISQLIYLLSTLWSSSRQLGISERVRTGWDSLWGALWSEQECRAAEHVQHKQRTGRQWTADYRSEELCDKGLRQPVTGENIGMLG